MSSDHNSPPFQNGHAHDPLQPSNGNGSVAVYPNGHPRPGGSDSALAAGLQILPLPYYASQTITTDKDDLDIRQFIQVIRRRAWLIGGVAVAVTLLSWASALTRRPVYQGGFQVLVDATSDAEAAGNLVTPKQNLDYLDYNTQLHVLHGSSILGPVQKRLQEKYPSVTYGEIAGSLQLDYLKGTKILAVTYRGGDPVMVQAILQELSDAYLQYSYQRQQDTLQQGIQFVETQLPKLRERVNNLQKNLEQFRQRYSLIDPETKGGELSGLLNSIHSEQQSTALELTQAQAFYVLLQRQLGSDVNTAVASAALSESNHYQQILKQIEEVETQIAVESARFQANSPQVQALVDRRANLMQLLSLEGNRVLGNQSGGLNDRMTSIPLDLTKKLVDTTNQLQVLEVRSRALQAAEQQLKEEFALIPSLSRQYTDLQRELQVATESLNRFLETRENLEIEAAQKSVPWQLISEPVVSTIPISPNIPRNLGLGLFAGILLGVGVGFLRDRFDHVFHSIDELKDAIKLPIIGSIPYSNELEDLKGIHFKERATNPAIANPQSSDPNLQWRAPLERSSKVYGYGYGTSPFQEAFRLLYSNLRFLSSDNPIRSIVVSSALPGDGKSTISFYTAHAAAAMGQRVLIVDADMRRPQLHQCLGLNNMRGLSNVLASGVDPDQVIQTVDPNLSVLTAGQIPPDPTKLLSSNRMKQLIDQFKDTYDLVLYDTPPLLGLADGSLLAGYLDGVVLVVGLGKTNRQSIKSVIDNLKVSSVPILGIVANGLTHSATYNTDYYYQHYQSYYYSAAKREPIES